MRRVLPKTILRPLQQSLRPAVTTPARRYESSSSSSSASTAVSEIPQIPLNDIITSPSPLHPSSASLRRTVPQKVQYRRDIYGEHPKYSKQPYSDPELYETSGGKEKRIPHNMERDFDWWRNKGFFPGEATVARTHYLEIMRLWRGRIRGYTGRVWDREKKEWVENSRLAFFMNEMDKKNLPYTHVDAAQDISAQDIFWARGLDALKLEEGDIVPEKVQEHLGEDFEATEFSFYEGQILFRPRGSEGDSRWDVVDDDELLRRAVPEIFNWQKIQERVDTDETINARPHKTELTGYRVYLPNITVRLVRNFTPPGQEYDPYVATFRVPPSMTKHDLRSYLKSVCNLDISFIRTDIYWGSVIRDPTTGKNRRQTGSAKNYKRAVVGLYEPFHYPDDQEELRALGRAIGRGDEMWQRREDAVNREYYLDIMKQRRKAMRQLLWKNTNHGYRMQGQGHKVSHQACVDPNDLTARDSSLRGSWRGSRRENRPSKRPRESCERLPNRRRRAWDRGSRHALSYITQGCSRVVFRGQGRGLTRSTLRTTCML